MLTDADLVCHAWEARERAAAAFSGYRVGAALMTVNGSVYRGANVESASYGLSCCAERVALFKAISEGESSFTRMAIAAAGPMTPVPCGACRQLLAEFAEGIDVLLSRDPEKFERVALADLLPRPFTPEFLK